MPADAATITATAPAERRVGPCPSRRHQVRHRVVLAALIAVAVAVAVTIGMLTWDNPYTLFGERWWLISNMRLSAIVVIALVTFCQSLATVTFQTVTNNRIITPSIMGFESLFVLVQTAIVYFFGATGLLVVDEFGRFLLQAGLMVLFAVLLYSWLLSGRLGNLHVMLLVGIVIGSGLGALSTFMQRMLDPNEFDILRARLFGNVGNANTDFLWFVAPVCALAGVTIWLLARRLNVVALGSDISTNLGLNHKRQLMLLLTLIAVLMAMSTSLVGPMTFLGFLVATLAYSVTDTYDHRRILPVAWLLGYVILGGAYFLLKHVLTMVDTVTIIVELVGGLVFLAVILRKGRL
ncbi:iron chelate uptake ABC transporter family permease subunit [Microbacterium halotolerans]|uniref:iron chelate uptake ABC transporter family permease subunit n=1 Tax=Microbacterium halotolerans TaxID=246613 RepID=UPI000E6A9800|nr:iron chelate uptake ABC transporter family permease subunit [Microbacterium halotolerans]